MLIIKKKKRLGKAVTYAVLEMLNFVTSPLLRARRKRFAKVADDRFDDEELISRLARLSQRHINLDVLYIQAACGSRRLPPVYWKDEFKIYYNLYVLFKEKVYVQYIQESSL